MDIAFKYDNIMYVDGEFLHADQTEKLQQALVVGRTAIIGAIDKMYEKTVKINQDKKLTTPLQRASVLVMKLAEDARVYFYETPTQIPSADVVTEKDDLRVVYHKPWEIAEDAGFIPESRSISFIGGYCLAVRDEPLKSHDQLVEHA